jgi:two-component system response regulator VicR
MGASVLIAEADDVLSDVLGYYLSERGYRVQTAADGLECLSKLREFQPETLVINVDLPWGGGDGVVTRIRENGDVSPVPLVLVTGNSGSDDLSARTGVPADCCFRKPYRFRRLLERIASHG